jgi:serine/threonine-protein kinase
VAEGRSARSDGVAGFGGATGPARDPGGPAGAAAAGPAGARAASGARRRAAGRRRAKLLPFTAAAVLLATAGLLWWLLGPDAGDSRQPAAGPVFSAAPGSAGAPSVGAPSAGAPSATGKPAVPGGAPTRGVAVPAGAGDDVAPGGAPALPGVTPPAGGGPGATTTPPPGQEEPEPTATTTTPPTDPPAETRTLSSSAGSVRATCPSPSTAELLSWSAVKPYKVKDVDAGPGSNAVATFRHGNNVVRMTVTCSGGVPSASTDNG